jgi:hypothetical protein
MPVALAIGIAKAGLPAVCFWQPAKKVIEGTILHHHDNDMLDSRFGWVG